MKNIFYSTTKRSSEHIIAHKDFEKPFVEWMKLDSRSQRVFAKNVGDNVTNLVGKNETFSPTFFALLVSP